MPTVSSPIATTGATTAQGWIVRPARFSLDHQAPVRRRRLQAEAEEADARDEQDRAGQADAEVDERSAP